MTAQESNIPIERPLLGEILVQRSIITPKQLEEALSLQKNEKGFLGEILVKLGYIDEKDIVVALVVQCSLPYIAINKYEIDEKVLQLIPEAIARQFHVIPLDRVGDVLSVVMANPLSLSLKEELARLTGCRIAAFISTKTEIDQAIQRWYTKGK